MIERKWNIPNYSWSQLMKHVNVTADTIDYETLDYTHDRRVQSLDDGTVLVTGGVLYSDTDRLVFQDGDWWYARGANSTDYDVLDDGDRYRTRLYAFGSVEEAVCHIVGAPAGLEYDGREYRMFLAMNEDGTAYLDRDTGLYSTLLIQHRPGAPAARAWCAFEEHADNPTRFYGETPEDAADAYFGIE